MGDICINIYYKNKFSISKTAQSVKRKYEIGKFSCEIG